MAENVVLQLILDGIPTLETKAELDVVRDVVKELSEKLKNALANGNSAEMILVNKEKYEDSGVIDLDRRSMAEKWFKAAKPYSKSTAYHQWRVWNWKKYRYYQGNVIIDKATGQSASSSSAKDEDEEEESGDESEEEESEEEESEEEEMAAVRVK